MLQSEWSDLFSDLSKKASRGDATGLRDSLWRNAETIRSYLLSFHLENAPAGLIEQYVNDALPRFLRTLEFVPLPCPNRVLEVGANPYLFHILLRKIFPQAALEGCNYFNHNIFDPGGGQMNQSMESPAAGERYDITTNLFNLETLELYPYDAGRFDLIFFCETLEHLIVNPLAVFGRLKRILSKGGFLMVTLPNAVRLSNLALILEGRNFFDIYSTNGPHGRHNREYTIEELVHLVQNNGYQVLRAETWDRFDYDAVPMWSFDYAGPSQRLSYTRSTVLRALELCGANVMNRGDNLYLLATKP